MHMQSLGSVSLGNEKLTLIPGIAAKVENKAQYEQYLEELEPLRKELGVELKELMYPNLPMNP